MFGLGPATRIYLAAGVTDMIPRRSIEIAVRGLNQSRAGKIADVAWRYFGGKVINLREDSFCGDAEHRPRAVGAAGVARAVNVAIAGLDQSPNRHAAIASAGE